MKNEANKGLTVNLIAGGLAGFCEAFVCHPFDTVKVRKQLRQRHIRITNNYTQTVNSNTTPQKHFWNAAWNIIQKEGFPSLYKGIGAVLTGMVPKMAIRFTSYDIYKEILTDQAGNITYTGVFLAGLSAGATEAALVVTPMEVVKIRLQAQRQSITDPLDIPKYRGAFQSGLLIVKEEGIQALYKGMGLTIIRQASCQGANFLVYTYLKSKLLEFHNNGPIPLYQTAIIGFIAGCAGPLINTPVDILKTRVQKSPSTLNSSQLIINISKNMIKNEGYSAFYKGVVHRLVAPSMATTWVVYELVSEWLTQNRR
ncbi:mitochondrial carrier domain-containing protein [Globomyces pollinis-pini]|nr:mitochondrial carrier domain-containing protein [Globomyces pollinis-pini]